MNILWIVNITFPEALSLIKNNDNGLKSTGGWMIGAANALIKHSEVKLCVVSVSQHVSKLVRLKGNQIYYYVIPYGKGNTRVNDEYKHYFRTIYDEYRPDVVHIHGSEYSHGLAFIKECGNQGVILSIQGMTSVYERYQLSGITFKDYIKSITFRDLISLNTLYHDKIDCQRQGTYEVEIVKRVSNVIGRTSWDQAHVWAINPSARYYFCNETLRDCFYQGSWSYDNCEKYSIFCSSAQDPVKGFHQLLKAMPIIKKHYPQTKVYVSGIDVTRSNEKYSKLKVKGYGAFLKRIIRENDLADSIIFLGPLDAEEMKKQYLKANVFVCPSSIENSPNSLGEAQLLGTPCIASYVGGIMDMMNGNEQNIYRFEETEMLASKICKVFEAKGNQTDILRKNAQQRHSPIINSERLLEIYNSVVQFSSR